MPESISSHSLAKANADIARAFDFTPEDLNANKVGLMSQRQQRHLQKARTVQVLVIGLVAAGFALAAYELLIRPVLMLPPLNEPLLTLRTLLIYAGIAAVTVLIVDLTTGKRYAADIRERRVDCLSGKARVAFRPRQNRGLWQRSQGSYTLLVANEPFLLTGNQANAHKLLDKQEINAYISREARALLVAELVDDYIEAAPKAFPPELEALDRPAVRAAFGVMRWAIIGVGLLGAVVFLLLLILPEATG
jgi:hypothetical protein